MKGMLFPPDYLGALVIRLLFTSAVCTAADFSAPLAKATDRGTIQTTRPNDL
jgi:hypothetical protein